MPYNNAMQRAVEKHTGRAESAASHSALSARSEGQRAAADRNRYASRTSIGNVAAEHSARVLSAGGEAGNARWNRQHVPVGASHSTPSVSARAPE